MDDQAHESVQPARYRDVRAFGARGDGRTDDTAAIEAALATGTVYFPQGQYRIRRSLQVDLARCGRLAVYGGGATLLHQGTGPALHLFGHHAGTASPKSVTASTWAHELMPRLEGLAIEGEHPEADGIRLEGTMMATLDGMFVARCRHGIHVVGRNRNIILASVHIYDNRGIGVYLDHVDLHQFNLHGSHISYNAAGGIKIEQGNIRNVQISGNDIEYNHAGGGSDVWLIAGDIGIREGAIVGNTIQAIPQSGGVNVRIDGYAPATPLKAGLLSITGNHISSQAMNIKITHSRGIVISGNTFTRGAERNIHITDSELINIGPNVFDDNLNYGGHNIGGIFVGKSRNCHVTGVGLSTPHGGDEARGATIEAVDCRGLNITGCNIIDPEVRGIWLEDVRDSLVGQCVILHGERRFRAAVVEAGASDRNLIVANRVDSGSEGAVVTVGASTRAEGNLAMA